MDKLNLTDFKEVCRTCALKKNNLTTIYTTELMGIYCTLTQIQMYENDGLPDLICFECSSEMIRFQNFKEVCIRSNTLFRQVLKVEEQLKIELDEGLIKTDSRAFNFLKVKQFASLNDDTTPNLESDTEKEKIFKFENFESESKKNSTEYDTDDHYESDIKDEWPSEDDVPIEVLNLSESKSKRETANKLRVKKVLTMGPDKCDPTTCTCKICNKVLVNINSLARHMEVHDENRQFSFTCNVCDKGFYEKGQLTKHIRRHKGETRYECESCNKGFYELSALAVHMKTFHKSEPLSCDQCKKKFYVRLQLDIHRKTHSTEKEHTCKKCGKSFYLPYQLKNHQFAHTKESLYPCLLCDKIFKYPVSLKKHHMTFHIGGNEPKAEICQVCGKSVKFLNSHMTRIHSEERPHKCTECPAAYVYKSQLDEHRQVKHYKVRKYPYLCSVCGKPCQTTTELRRHTRRHTGEKPFECVHCEKKYKTNAELNVHIRSHTGERPYVCPVCQKGFYTSQILKHHVRTHTGERPHECDICGRAFTQNSALKTHMKIH